jgi:histidinol phosphatase-like PHP family hydrolase/predicted nuclease with RNAse H fold/dephospho-CoA kinase
LPRDYLRIRDFEYVQPIYDLAFLLEVEALAKGAEIPKYRTFSLWRAAYSLDGYGTSVDRWLDGSIKSSELDYVPSNRIAQYVRSVRHSGSIPELRPYRSEKYARCLRLRALRGLGPSQIALTVTSGSLREEWLNHVVSLNLQRERITDLYSGSNRGPWQTAHVVPPLLRFLNALEEASGKRLGWGVSGIADPFESIRGRITVSAPGPWTLVRSAVARALKQQRLFRLQPTTADERIALGHQLGWTFEIHPHPANASTKGLWELARDLDPLAAERQTGLASDLHVHTAWSDGTASVSAMAQAVVSRGLQYFAVTDHSRSSKLQGGLTPVLWLRQANALTLASRACPILHGIEVDILKDGTLDLPRSLLSAADLVVASVHSSWTEDVEVNTGRLLRAVESGCVDVLAHPTSALVGKPGVPNYARGPASVDWDRVFEACAEWGVALEFNCFPSRLDLPPSLLASAVEAGCAVSIGSDAHARSHLLNLRFGEAALRKLEAPVVLNRLSYDELANWVAERRSARKGLARKMPIFAQREFQFEPPVSSGQPAIKARIQPPQNIPAGSCVVGIDLTAGDKATGIALLSEFTVDTCSLLSDEDILAYVRTRKPGIVSIDSPLGLPRGGDSIDPAAGIVRVAEHDLASVGIPAYPALIDSMRELTLRGIRLRRAIERSPEAPRVIESYPGAAQDILCIPRKQKSLDLLREGLRRLGLRGSGLETRSHDEMDAITSAIVGRYFESGLFEPMGIPSEAQLIVPKVRPLVFDTNPVICLAGKTGAGKSVVARYLSLFYGFEWIRTRNLIRDLLIEDLAAKPGERLFNRAVDPDRITETDLRESGAVILDVHRQVPLRKKLTAIVQRSQGPVVVDSIRDIGDLDRGKLEGRAAMTWFVDCSDSIIRQRLTEKSKMGERRLATESPVDRTALLIRSEVEQIVPNSASLEELRWCVDDALFGTLDLHC